jgi:hypothetical protein
LNAPRSVSTKVCDSVSNRFDVPYQANLLDECDTVAPNLRSKLRRTSEFRPSAATIRS